jgi:hypothetical protein
MDEIYRMLGREHERDLEREARNRGLAAAIRADRGAARERVEAKRRKPGWRVRHRLAALLRA